MQPALRFKELDSDIAMLIADYNATHPDAPYAGISQLTVSTAPDDSEDETAPETKSEPRQRQGRHASAKPKPRAGGLPPVRQQEYAALEAKYAHCLTTKQVADLVGMSSEMVNQHRNNRVGGLHAHDLTNGHPSNRNRYLYEPDVVAAYVQFIQNRPPAHNRGFCKPRSVHDSAE